jgi:hypothetical protein
MRAQDLYRASCRVGGALGTTNHAFAGSGTVDRSRDVRAAGGEIIVSDDTILRAVKRVDVDTGAFPLRVIGVDDWAWRKGQTYGTILVDLERRGVVDLTSRSLCGISGGLARPTPWDRIHQPGSARFIRRWRSQRRAPGAADCRSLSPRPQSEHRGRAGVSAPSFVSIPTAAPGHQSSTLGRPCSQF